jgi:hypothetical protein
MMRFWDWGQADAEFADWHVTELIFRTVYGPWGYTVGQSETDGSYDPDSTQFGQTGTGFIAESIVWILKDQVKAKLGQIPVLISATLECTNNELASTWANIAEVRRMIQTWDKGDTTDRRYDKSASLYWYLQKEHIVRGQDVETNPAHSTPTAHTYNVWDTSSILITDIVTRALRDNTDLKFHLSVYHVNGAKPTDLMDVRWDEPTVFSRRPYLRFAYLYPIEFYHDDGAGDLDLSSPVTDDPGDEYYVGAVEPGQTGTAVKQHARNYSGAVQQVEIFDDHPEYTTPVTRIGSSQLDYIELAEASVSQKYTAVFYSATQFEVKAEAYRDNATSLHPQIDADASWRGTVGSDFTAPSGGLTIPSAAWQPGTALNDEYETGVRGNSTVTSWPADANDQVEITRDSGGSPDAAGWRIIPGRREETRAQVTIDATTKLIPTRMVVPTDWPTDTRAFIMDATKMNEGQVDSVQEAAIGADVFTGSGLDDLTLSGNYNGVWTDQLRVEIDGTGTPDTFRWSIDGGATWEVEDVNMTGSAQLLQDGIYVTFAATTGHTLGDLWNSDVEAWAIQLKSLTANSNVYASGSRIGTTLPIRDVAAAVFTTVDQDSGVSQGLPARLYIADTTGFQVGQDVFIQAPNDPATAETIEIDSIGSGFLDLVSAMTQDYVDGDFVTQVGTGQVAFWARAVATPTTTEERKEFRLNARML